MSDPIGDIARFVVTQAIDSKVSAIQVELTEEGVMVNHYREGTFDRQRTLPADLYTRVSDRYKLWAGVDLLDSHYPLQGQFTLTYGFTIGHGLRHYRVAVTWEAPQQTPRVTMSIAGGVATGSGNEELTIDELLRAAEESHSLPQGNRSSAASSKAAAVSTTRATRGRVTTARSFSEFLITTRLLTEEQLQQARVVQQQSQTSLSRALVAAGCLTESELVAVEAAYAGYPYADLSNCIVEEQALLVVAWHLMERLKVLPLRRKGRVLIVATADPMNVLTEDMLRLATGLEVQWVVAMPDQIEAGIKLVWEIYSKTPI